MKGILSSLSVTLFLGVSLIILGIMCLVKDTFYMWGNLVAEGVQVRYLGAFLVIVGGIVFFVGAKEFLKTYKKKPSVPE